MACPSHEFPNADLDRPRGVDPLLDPPGRPDELRDVVAVAMESPRQVILALPERGGGDPQPLQVLVDEGLGLQPGSVADHRSVPCKTRGSGAAAGLTVAHS